MICNNPEPTLALLGDILQSNYWQFARLESDLDEYA
jgi:hypothetical protein